MQKIALFNGGEIMGKVEITVVSQKGVCDAKHKKGQKFLSKGQIPKGFCTPAFVTLYPYIKTLLHGGNFPYEKEGELLGSCADARNPVVFKIKRIP